MVKFGNNEKTSGLTTGIHLFFLLLLAISAATIQLGDPDTWWLLARGKLFFQQGISVTNTFSFTFPDHSWQSNYWLFGTILHIAEIIAWPYAVQVVPIIFVFAAIVFLSFTALNKVRSNNFLLLCTLITLVVFACRFRFVPRPHLASYLGLSILFYLWVKQPKRLWAWTGILGVIWVNFHAGVIFGAISLMLLTIGTGMERNWLLFKRAFMAFGSFFLCSLINPDIFYPYSYALEHAWKFQNLNILVGEFTAAGIKEYPLFYLLAVFSLPAAWSGIRTRNYTFPLLVVFWFLLSIKANRIIPYFAIAAMPGIYAGMHSLIESFRHKLKWRSTLKLFSMFFMVIITLLVNREFRIRSDYLKFGLGINERILPVGAADFIEKEDLHGFMYNDFGDGGFFIWRFYPERKVFQDGRTQAYPNEFIKLFNSRVPYQAILAELYKSDIEYATVERHTGYKDIGNLFLLAGWPMIYLDGHNAVFVKPGYLSNNALKRLGYFTVPYHMADHVKIEKNRDRVKYELFRINPDRLILESDFFRFAIAALRINELGLAERFLHAGLKLLPDSQRLKGEHLRLMNIKKKMGEGRLNKSLN